MKIVFGSDHAGFELKEYLKKAIEQAHTIVDVGTTGHESVDYPDFGAKAARLVASGEMERAVLICGTGIGMSVVANKVPGIRAALVSDLYTAVQSRRHLDANVLVLGAQVIGKGLALEILKNWLVTPFEGGRHARRIEKIKRLEEDDWHGTAGDGG